MKSNLKVLSFQNGVMKFGNEGRNAGQILSDAQKAAVEDLLNVENNDHPDDKTSGETQQPTTGGILSGEGGGETKFVLPEDFDDLKVDDLKKLAADNGIDLGDATLKDDIKAKIKAAAE